MRKCAVCGKEFQEYVPIEQKYIDMPKQYGREREAKSELLNKVEYSCPYCYSADRDRMITMFLKKLHAELSNGIDILEIAPSGALQRYLYKCWGKSNLYTVDLFMDGVDYKADIQNMENIKDGAFDFVVCSHVLEHVQDDRKAIRELCRVLDKRGLGIIIVPIDLNQAYTDEEWGLSEAENIRRFGQGDHVRAYNKYEYIERLKECGFGVHQIGKEYFPKEEFEENALIETSTLYLVYKNSNLYGTLDDVIKNFKSSHENIEVKREYSIAPDECKYWIDLCVIEEGMLKIWGWTYISGLSSRNVKFKLMLEGSDYDYIYGITTRKREDIQEHFGSEEMDYSYSGIDVLMPVEEIKPAAYNVYILIANGDKKYRIEAARGLVVD